MSHTYKTEAYAHYEIKNAQGMNTRTKFVIHHNNDSRPGSPVTITPCEVDGEELAPDDPRRVGFTIPFGVLAEFVGYRVLCDSIAQAEEQMGHPRHALALRDQGGYAVLD